MRRAESPLRLDFPQWINPSHLGAGHPILQLAQQLPSGEPPPSGIRHLVVDTSHAKTPGQHLRTHLILEQCLLIGQSGSPYRDEGWSWQKKDTAEPVRLIFMGLVVVAGY